MRISDWSSDVCSSDLTSVSSSAAPRAQSARAPRQHTPTGAPNAAFPSPTSSSPRNGRKSPTTQHVTRPLGSRQPERETHDQTHICVAEEPRHIPPQIHPVYNGPLLRTEETTSTLQ